MAERAAQLVEHVFPPDVPCGNGYSRSRIGCAIGSPTTTACAEVTCGPRKQ